MLNDFTGLELNSPVQFLLKQNSSVQTIVAQ